MLTTFNEVNMQPVNELRQRFKAEFEVKHGVKLGYMSFFVRAVCQAMQQFPVVNAAIDGSDIVWHGDVDIGIAISSPRGLVVPILRRAQTLSSAEIEAAIADFARRAREAKLTLEDLSGGTFSITNGGVFGSLLSTPILNPPQSAILGMHTIQERPVAENGQVVIRPMMYLALTYDHRLIDGRDAVQFLVAVKAALEAPNLCCRRIEHVGKPGRGQRPAFLVRRAMPCSRASTSPFPAARWSPSSASAAAARPRCCATSAASSGRRAAA